MFRRDYKKQFNLAKYKYQANPAHIQSLRTSQRDPIKTVAMAAICFLTAYTFTKRYYEAPHNHKDTTKPMTLLNGELHPFEIQPKSAEGMPVYTKHLNNS
ncbi:unnamed protein product [Moneuplotes crassus]|uniref:Uncharacterized protein n=1 Tax=Euplotes crassus TaxID=5936 RepID=A0AAD1Y9Q1_EUPCR|nr:unnamed protein product [Moneuplotes crassus]